MKYSVEKCAIILIIMNCNWITVEGTSVTVDFKKALLKRMTSSKQTFYFFIVFFLLVLSDYWANRLEPVTPTFYKIND